MPLGIDFDHRLALLYVSEVSIDPNYLDPDTLDP